MHRLLILLLLVFATGCASRPLPKYEPPLAPAPFQQVRTTAYTHTEADHRKHGNKCALGTPLQSGPVRSAAADWSRWPAGTVFRVWPDGAVYQVDDYGWALSGTNTIDLYMPTRGEMNRWGVRRKDIEILEWGDPARSYSILKSRERYPHVKRMVKQLEQRYRL